MGGPHHDEPSQAELERRRALYELRLEREQAGSRGRISRLVSLPGPLDRQAGRGADDRLLHHRRLHRRLIERTR